MDKPTLAETLKTNRAIFEQIVAQISEARMLEPLHDGQTGKDIVAHITTWEQRLVRWLEATARGETPAPPRPPVSRTDIDMLNALSLTENKDLSLQAVMENSRRSFARVLELLQGFSEHDLFEPDRYSWISEAYDGRALWRAFIAGPATRTIRTTFTTCSSMPICAQPLCHSARRSRHTSAAMSTPITAY